MFFNFFINNDTNVNQISLTNISSREWRVATNWDKKRKRDSCRCVVATKTTTSITTTTEHIDAAFPLFWFEKNEFTLRTCIECEP